MRCSYRRQFGGPIQEQSREDGLVWVRFETRCCVIPFVFYHFVLLTSMVLFNGSAIGKEIDESGSYISAFLPNSCKMMAFNRMMILQKQIKLERSRKEAYQYLQVPDHVVEYLDKLLATGRIFCSTWNDIEFAMMGKGIQDTMWVTSRVQVSL